MPLQPLALLSVITPSSTLTPVTPSTPATAAVTSRVIVSFIGQPATVRRIATVDLAGRGDVDRLTMPSSVIGLPDLGVVDGGQGSLDGVERSGDSGGHVPDGTCRACPWLAAVAGRSHASPVCDRGPERAASSLAWRRVPAAHAAVTRRLEADLLAERSLPLASYDVLVQLVEAPDRRLRMTDLAGGC